MWCQERTWDVFVPPSSVLFFPEEDQLTGVYNCLPKRIITMAVCGQRRCARGGCVRDRYWLYKREKQKAQRHFYEASRMLVLSFTLSNSQNLAMDSESVTDTIKAYKLASVCEVVAFPGLDCFDAALESFRTTAGEDEIFVIVASGAHAASDCS